LEKNFLDTYACEYWYWCEYVTTNFKLKIQDQYSLDIQPQQNMWWDGEHAYAYAYQYSKTMTPDQAAFVIQQAWRKHKFYYDYYDYEDEISFYDLYPDRPMDYEGMSQVNIEY